MTYHDMPLIIPVLATGYLLTIYFLLMLAERTAKSVKQPTQKVREASSVR